jgi:hypothetical protein
MWRRLTPTNAPQPSLMPVERLPVCFCGRTSGNFGGEVLCRLLALPNWLPLCSEPKVDCKQMFPAAPDDRAKEDQHHR